MALPEHNQQLNEVLIRIFRGLLQYAGECGPWAGAQAAGELHSIEEMVAAQREHVAALAELLQQRDWVIDFGSYPDDFTDLHYVSLDFLLEQLIAEQETLISQLKQTSAVITDDLQGHAVLEAIRPVAEAHLENLRRLTGSTAAGSPA